MNKYPQLSEMGILHPEEIRSYIVNSIAGIDVLRIFYTRKSGSLLPKSRSYEYPRVQRTIADDSGETKTVLETAPELRAAIAELQEVLQSRESLPEIAASVLEELESLEHELACRIQHIRELLKNPA
jgi:hypothetical protein